MGVQDHETWKGEAQDMMADWAVDRGFDDSSCLSGEVSWHHTSAVGHTLSYYVSRAILR